MKNKPLILALTSVAVLLCGPAVPQSSAQIAVPPPMPAYQPLSDQQLDQLLGPIALYPDPLLAIILPAATLPTEVVMADRYVASSGDPNALDQQPWDASVQALARYPSVLQYMDDNLAWTTEVGQAFINQQQEVMDSIQRLRISAQNYGNLQSTAQQEVVNDNGDVEILPVDPNIVYVPTYQPDDVYYRSGFGLGFGVGFAIGPWLNCDFDWHNHDVFFWDHAHPRPADWWHERPEQRRDWLAHQGSNWHPADHIWRPEDHRDVDVAHRGDRGWVAPVVRTVDRRNETADHRPAPMAAADHRPVEVKPAPVVEHRPVVEPKPTPAPRPEPVHVEPAKPQPKPVSTGAFVGSGSSHDARDFSDRGRQSMQAVAHTEPAHAAAPAPRPAPPAQGGRGGGPQPRH